MKNRITKYLDKEKPKENITNLPRFFLACEFKPHSDLWSAFDPFAYDVKPAFIHGSLGILSYEPETYSIIDTNEDSMPMLGYIFTITHPETALLLDKVKGFNGVKAFNYHHRRLVTAYTDLDKWENAWCYILTDNVLETYEQLEQVEMGLWDQGDKQQKALLEKIGEAL